jgi:hypothetical protein
MTVLFMLAEEMPQQKRDIDRFRMTMSMNARESAQHTRDRIYSRSLHARSKERVKKRLMTLQHCGDANARTPISPQLDRQHDHPSLMR